MGWRAGLALGGVEFMAYIDQYRTLHRTRIYGASSQKKSPFIIPHVQRLGPLSAIDYGCGQSSLDRELKEAGVETVYRYDPAIPTYAARPERDFDLLVSVDVLEHIPEHELDDVLSDMRSLARHALIIVDTEEAVQILPNGQNAHATIRPHGWWRQRLAKHYPELYWFHVIPLTRACYKTWRTPLAAQAMISIRGTARAAARGVAKRIKLK